MLMRELLLLCTVVLGIAFVRLARRLDGSQRLYTVVVAAVFGLAVVAMALASSFLAVLAVSLTVLVVIAPWWLEGLARLAFSRGKLRLAVGFAGARAILMPGSGLARQQEILHGLALLERDGVDRALAHFKDLAGDTEDGGELALINEQIVSMLLYGQRWNEGIAHYESRFHPRYAAVRPALALGLLRAYGEAGQIDRAAGLLRALEEGPIGADPRSSGVVSQARLTFLAYAGVARSVSAALTEERRRVLGLSRASGALFRGIAFGRAGEAARAEEAFHEVAEVARAAEDRVVEASKRAIVALTDGQGVRVELPPDLRGYAEAVAQRLELFLRAAPSMQRPGTLIATPACITVLVLGYLAVLVQDGGGLSLLRAGALTPELWRAGQWPRMFAGIWTHGQGLALLLNLYALGLSGAVFERVHGTARTIIAALGGAALGLAAAASVHGSEGLVFGGGHLLATAVTAGAIWTLTPWRSPMLPARARRAVLVPLGLVIVAEAVTTVRGVLVLDVPWIGLVIAAGFGALVAMVPSFGMRHRWLAPDRWIAAGLVLVTAASVGWVATGDPVQAMAAGPRRPVVVGKRTLALPSSFSGLSERERVFGLSLPLEPGAIDTLPLRLGQQVQLLAAPRDDEASMLFAIDPALARELVVTELAVPESFARHYREAGGDPGTLHAWSLRRNGVVVGILIARRSEGGEDLGWLASPPEALTPASRVYATILARAS